MNEEDFKLAFGAKERQKKDSDWDLDEFLDGSVSPLMGGQKAIASKWTIEMQNKTPSCGAHAGAMLSNILETEFLGDVQRNSPEYLWKVMRLADGLSPDQGSTMDTIFDRLKKVGICKYDLLPNNSNVSDEDYADPKTLTNAMHTDATQRTVEAYAFSFSPSMDKIRQAIDKYGAVLLLMRVGNEFWVKDDGGYSWAEDDILPLRANRPIEGGHFVVAHSWDDKYIYFINSWSDKWGREGVGYFDETYITRVVEMGTAVDTPYKFQFVKNLWFGMTDPDVKMLQQVLNRIPETRLPGPGGGSPGQETEYFGPKTLSAVMRFQKLHDIYPQLGYVGPFTRAKLNSL